MVKQPITVFIVDDSKVARQLLAYIIESDPELKVIGFAEDGADALKQLRYIHPDVITMDIVMPHLDGFEVTRQIMETKPIPIIIISAGYDPSNSLQAFKAIEIGALAIFSKPIGSQDSEFHQKAKEITTAIKTVAGIKLIKRVASRPPVSRMKRIADGAGALFTSSNDSSPLCISGEANKGEVGLSKWGQQIEAIAIGASLGGPPAIAMVLANLPATFPVPIFIVQHISVGFTEGFVRWLQGRTSLRVSLAKNGEKAVGGSVYVAPDSCQMEIKKGGIIELSVIPKDRYQPSVAHLFKSMALTYGMHSVGVLLTGMGKDGAKELLMMRQMGAYTIAQDEASSVMFGMPREAIEIDGVCQVVPIEQIAAVLNKLVNR